MRLNLSENFTLEEFTFSQNAARYGIRNEPNQQDIARMKVVAETLEVIRNDIRLPIIVTSGFRCLNLNSLTPGSSATSGHTRGTCADFISPKFGTPYQLAQRILELNIKFDQLIYEHTWLHIGIESPMRQQVLTLKRGGGYEPGLLKGQP